MKIYDGDIPFSKDTGDQLHYPEPWMVAKGYTVMRPNGIFIDTLTIDGMERGRSAAYFHFRRKTTGAQVVVFMTDAIDMFKESVKGELTASFVFCKRGMNYGCKLYR